MTSGGGSQIAVILLDENGCIVDAHASCVDTFGWRREELLGKDVRELLQYGRDLLMSQLHLLEERDPNDNTSFTIRVLAKRKDQQQFPARATVRRFSELECWTVAFYNADTELTDSNVQPAVSAEEIALAKRALEESNAPGREPKTRKQKEEPKKGEGMSVSRLWRNSRLLFSSRDDKTAQPADTETPVVVAVAEEAQIAEEASALALECATAAAAAAAAAALAPPADPSVNGAGNAISNTPPTAQPEPEPLPVVLSITPPQPPPAAPAPAPVENRPVQPRFQTQAQPGDTAAIARLKAELEKERGERTRIEQRAASLGSQVQTLHLQLSESLNLERENQTRLASVEQELRTAQDLLTRSKATLENERHERRSTEDQLSVVRELNTRLQENLTLFEKGRKNSETAQADVRSQIERSHAALKEAESTLDKEREARLRLEQTLASSLREHRAVEQKLSVELAGLRSALESAQLERSRGEEAALRQRADALQVASGARARVNRFRDSFSRLLDHINGTTRELLQSPLSEEQKCVIETLLQDVIALEATLEKEGMSSEGNSSEVSVAAAA